MKKILFLFLIILLAACGNSTQSTQQTSEETGELDSEKEEYVLTLSHGYTTESFMHTFMEWFNEELQKHSDGQLSIEIYPNAQLMPVDQEIPAILQGQIDMTYTTSPVLASFDPIWNFYELPFIFDYDPNDPAIFLENRMKFNKSANGGQKIEKLMEEKGLKVLSLSFIDLFGSVYSAEVNKLVTDLDSVKGLKLRTPGGMIGPETVKAIGASSVTIAGAEVITALQQKTVDGLLTTPLYATDAKLPVKSFSVVPLFNSIIPLIMSIEKFESLPEDLQEILVQTGKDLEEHAKEKVLEKGLNAYTTLENEGVEIHYPTEEEITEWKEATKPVWGVFEREVEGGKELLEVITNLNE